MTRLVRASARARALTMVGATIVAGASFVGQTGAAQATALQQGTTVAVSPAVAAVECGQTVTVDIQINSVTNLYGLDFKLSYDPAVVEVVDSNPAAPGVQILSGPFPDVTAGRGLIQVNNVDIAGGIISYAAALINPTEPVDGSGVAAQVTFKGLAAGSSPLGFVSVLLSDRQARPITVTPVDGTVRVTCSGVPVPSRTPGGTAMPRPTATPRGTPGTGGDPGKCYHVVDKGETLYGIAAAYGTTVAALQQLNGISNPNWIVAGTRLKVPCDGTHATPVPGATAVPGGHPGGGTCFTYTVKPGDTLSRIAAWNNDTVYGIASRNYIANPDLIRDGQALSVCPNGGGGHNPPPPPPTGQCKLQHYVKPGETLSGIAWVYGLSTYVLQQANGLSNPNLIYAGQSLCIP